MSDQSSIIEVQESWKISPETLGSKPKFWFRMTNSEGNATKWLFKKARPDTGEHWAEKIASEIADELLGLPTHQVRLATYQGSPGCAVKSFLDGKDATDLIHGNEILGATIKGYSKEKVHNHADHCLRNIILGLDRMVGKFGTEMVEGLRDYLVKKGFPIIIKDEIQKEADIGTLIFRGLTGYLVFDALVGNTDRHHENWGCLLEPSLTKSELTDKLEFSFFFSLAPTFDHGSSLGRELSARTSQITSRRSPCIRRISQAWAWRHIRFARSKKSTHSDGGCGMDCRTLSGILGTLESKITRP